MYKTRAPAMHFLGVTVSARVLPHRCSARARARAAFLLLREISFVIMWRGNARGTVNTRDLFPFLCLGPFLPSFSSTPLSLSASSPRRRRRRARVSV